MPPQRTEADICGKDSEVSTVWANRARQALNAIKEKHGKEALRTLKEVVGRFPDDLLSNEVDKLKAEGVRDFKDRLERLANEDRLLVATLDTVRARDHVSEDLNLQNKVTEVPEFADRDQLLRFEEVRACVSACVWMCTLCGWIGGRGGRWVWDVTVGGCEWVGWGVSALTVAGVSSFVCEPPESPADTRACCVAYPHRRTRCSSTRSARPFMPPGASRRRSG